MVYVVQYGRGASTVLNYLAFVKKATAPLAGKGITLGQVRSITCGWRHGGTQLIVLWLLSGRECLSLDSTRWPKEEGVIGGLQPRDQVSKIDHHHPPPFSVINLSKPGKSQAKDPGHACQVQLIS